MSTQEAQRRAYRAWYERNSQAKIEKSTKWQRENPECHAVAQWKYRESLKREARREMV